MLIKPTITTATKLQKHIVYHKTTKQNKTKQKKKKKTYLKPGLKKAIVNRETILTANKTTKIFSFKEI